MTKQQQLKYEAAIQYLKQKGYYWEMLNNELKNAYIDYHFPYYDHQIDLLFSLNKNSIDIKIPTEEAELEVVDLLYTFDIDKSYIEFDSYNDSFDWEYGSQFGSESGTVIEDIDVSGAVSLYEFFFWGETSEEIDSDEAISKISKLFKISEDEFKQDLEYFQLVVEYEAIQIAQDFYEENPGALLD